MLALPSSLAAHPSSFRLRLMRLNDHVFPIACFDWRDRMPLDPRFEHVVPAPIKRRQGGHFLHEQPLGRGVELQALGQIGAALRGGLAEAIGVRLDDLTFRYIPPDGWRSQITQLLRKQQNAFKRAASC